MVVPETLTLVGSRLRPETGLPPASTRLRVTVPLKPSSGSRVSSSAPEPSVQNARSEAPRLRAKLRTTRVKSAVRVTPAAVATSRSG